MDLISEVLPEPVDLLLAKEDSIQILFYKDSLPDAPANSTLKRPMALPRSVKGRRLGILMLGMMSWEAPPGPRRGDAAGCSSSSPDVTAWLHISSVMEISSSGRKE